MQLTTRSLWRLVRLAAGLVFIYALARTQSALPDLKISNIGSQTPRPDGVLTATVSNSGTQTVVTSVAFYLGSQHTGAATEFYRLPITLTAGNFANISAPPRAMQEGEIYSICVDPNNAIAEQNENNNCETVSVSSGYSDLSIKTADISITPVGANPGEPVRVSAIVRSQRNTPAQTLVRLFQSHPQSPNAKLLGAVSVNVPGLGVAVANWTIVRPDGDTNLFVSLDDVMPRDVAFADNLASRNIFLKAIINTGRLYAGGHSASSSPAVGDLTGSGQPVMVFAEHTGSFGTEEGRLTALQVFNDGTSRELWSRLLVPAPSKVLSPAIADLDGDGSPEIVVQAVRSVSTTAGEVHIFALDRTGATKWTQSWPNVGRPPCANLTTRLTPVLGDMNRDGVADVVVVDNELIILDGRNGAVLLRNSNLPFNPGGWCSLDGSSAAIADLDGDGSNEFIIANFGIHVFNSNGSLRWKGENNNIYTFALLDTDLDKKPEIVIPVHRQRFDILDAQTGALKKRLVPPSWTPNYSTIAASTSLDPGAFPYFAVANNDFTNGTGALDNLLNVKWWSPTPLSTAGAENPSQVVLADLLGQGRPQVISRSDRRAIGIQDMRDGRWLLYLDIFGFPFMNTPPVPVDVDGDGRGEVIVTYGQSGGLGKFDYEPQYPVANYLVFGSDHWKKIPSTWNHNLFVPNQVDKKLAFRHDYQPYNSHNTWFQQPLRKPCDVDFDDDVDQNDVNSIFAAAGKPATEGDPRDFDKDGTITVADARACALKCTSPNCAATTQPPRLLSVGPRRAFPGSSLQVTIRGEFVNFKTGQTTASFGPGISVGGAAPGAMGPVTVLDFETATASLTIQPGQTGDRTVTVATGSFVASRTDAFSLSAGNLPPQVQAGPDRDVILPGSISLSGIATDDGLPNPNLVVTWQSIGGPGTVTFSNPNSLATSASFSKEGYYHLRLSAFDGQYIGSDDVGVRVILGNQAPYVSAGPDRSVPLDAPLRLNGEVLDDGLPAGSPVSIQWSKESGPGTVLFTPANTAVTNAVFSAAGTYTLRLSANDTQLSASASVIVVITPPLPEILSVTPDSAAPGQTRTVAIAAKNANFVSGVTQASFGAGISVGGAAAGAFGPVRVLGPGALEADITVAPAVTLGPRAITIRTTSESASKADAFTVGTIGVPYSIRLNLTDTVAAPGGSITARPQVVDAAGNVISGAGQVFTMTVTPRPGLTTGNPPVINGLTASFPKLAKRLINQNPAADPTGEFADGDPTDPNFGKETGGVYTLEVRLQGGTVSGTTNITVLPSGTAGKTLQLAEYANQLDRALAAGRQALQSQSTAELDAARGQFGAILSNADFNVRIFAANNVLTPPNGAPLTIAQVAARFPAAPDDARFGQTITAIINQVRLLRQRIEIITPATLSQADIDALGAGAAAYRNLNLQLAALKPGPLGVNQHGDKLNELMRLELPRLFDAISRKALDVLPGSSGVTFKAAATRDSGSPFFDNLYAIFKDLAGYAKQNIIELVASLANDLINIAIANAVNAGSEGSLTIDFIAAGGQFSFVCPLWQNTYVEGSGFSIDVTKNDVVQIGCINSAALRDLLSLKKPKDLSAAFKLIDKVKKIVEAMGLDKIASAEHPDFLREGLFEGTQMVFANGWQRVNQGRLPCVGIVIAFNLETGDFQAVNMNMLPTCP